MSSRLYQHIYDLVSQVPAGYVATYGSLARLASCTARTVGFAMAALPSGSNVPWQRVINSQGKISPRADGDRDFLQRELLITDGIEFSSSERIDLEKYSWNFPDLGER